MSAVISRLSNPARAGTALRATTDPIWLRWVSLSVAVIFLSVFLLVPLAAVFTEALRRGVGAYFSAFASDETRAAIKLTFLTAAIAVPLNLVFWCGGIVGHREIPIPRQKPAHHPD